MIAGRTRFYVVAGITGAIMGEALAAAMAIGAVQLADLWSARRWPATDLILASALGLVVAGVVGGAWAGVATMRWWYRREASAGRET